MGFFVYAFGIQELVIHLTRAITERKKFKKMKKVFWSNSTAQRTSGYNKQSTQNMFLEKAFECSPNTLQWLPMNQNKQDSENRSVAYYSEVPNYDREQVYNWYQTVPLRHDSFVDDVNPKGTIEEHMNRKGQ